MTEIITQYTDQKDVERFAIKTKVVVGDIITFGNGRQYLKRIDARRTQNAKNSGLKKYSKFELVEY